MRDFIGLYHFEVINSDYKLYENFEFFWNVKILKFWTLKFLFFWNFRIFKFYEILWKLKFLLDKIPVYELSKHGFNVQKYVELSFLF
jgi:hypothetical protein